MCAHLLKLSNSIVVRFQLLLQRKVLLPQNVDKACVGAIHPVLPRLTHHREDVLVAILLVAREKEVMTAFVVTTAPRHDILSTHWC